MCSDLMSNVSIKGPPCGLSIRGIDSWMHDIFGVLESHGTLEETLCFWARA